MKMASDKVVVEGSDVPASQIMDFYRQVGDRSLNGLEIRALLGHKRPSTLATVLTPDDMALLGSGIAKGRITRETLQNCLEHRYPFGTDKIQIDWREVYRLVGIETWRFESYLPGPSSDDVWEVVVLPGVSMANLVSAINMTGASLKQEYDYESNHYADSRGGQKHDRDPYFDGAYRISFARSLSSELDLSKVSSSEFYAEKRQGITIYEKLLLELGVILATGRVMEKETICICTGSDHGNNNNLYIGCCTSEIPSFNMKYGVSFLGRAWNAGYGPQNIRTHMVIPDSFRKLR